MKKQLTAIVARAEKMHLPEGEFVRRAGINRIRWWRAMTGRSGKAAMLKLVGEAERAISIMELGMKPCAMCGKSSLEARACETFGCPFPFPKEG